MKTLLIFGTGGMGREAEQLVRDLESVPRSGERFRVVGFVDDHAVAGSVVHGMPVHSLDQAARHWPGASITIAVGRPELRERLAAAALDAGLHAVTLVHPRTDIGGRVNIGPGSYVGPASVLTCDIIIGSQVQINVGCVIHHDSVIEDFVTLSPRATVLGAVRIGTKAFIGAGATIRQGVRVGAGAVVGMGAAVVCDVPDGETWVGVPARRLSRHRRIASPALSPGHDARQRSIVEDG
jgi:sugar O-acyltransferase (sialic acid O-acetyltransferase NeuD family)